MKKEVKMLNFDIDDERQARAFNFLEKVRYYQTKFIVALVEKFCEENNITDSTNYDVIKNLVKDFSTGDEIAPLEVSDSTEQIKIISSKIERILSILTEEGEKKEHSYEENRAQIEHKMPVRVERRKEQPIMHIQGSGYTTDNMGPYEDDDDYGLEDMMSSFEEAKKS